ncbi:hypothetical protein PHYPSEUDO_008209 [Phytophthora pseudosyringae]|uniref:HTH CENPB-type domain-containing protein n=1 Tax=Phytophthora pseudosyringae TaxID=221518 RepID=A0A8T1VFA6_9STRA|nr:hypothetical protein PHYPSEUDO_008209 [Phytophthora pseudosyringae]
MPVSATMLQQEALEAAKMYDVPPAAFGASATWMKAYLTRYSLSLRARTRQGQSPPADSAAVAQEFAATLRRCIVEEGIAIVYNADQTADNGQQRAGRDTRVVVVRRREVAWDDDVVGRYL